MWRFVPGRGTCPKRACMGHGARGQRGKHLSKHVWEGSDSGSGVGKGERGRWVQVECSADNEEIHRIQTRHVALATHQARITGWPKWGDNEHARKKKCLCTSQIGRGAFPRMARAPEDSYASADSESREIVPTCVVTRVPIPHPPTPNPRRGTRV